MATGTKKSKASKRVASNGGPPIPAPVSEVAVMDEPVVEEAVAEVVDETNAASVAGIPLVAPVVLNMRGQAVAPGREDTVTGGSNTSRYTGAIHLSSKQRIGLYRLRKGLTATGEMVEMPNLKGRKEVVTDADAIRWIFDKLADAG